MNIKRIIAILLVISSLFLSGGFDVAIYAKKSEYTEITLSMFGNLSSQDNISGIYKDNVFYVSLETLKKIGVIEILDDETITTNKGARTFTIDIKQQIIFEKFAPGYKLAIPICEYLRDTYISALHFFRYIGISVQINPNSVSQFIYYSPYTMYDALTDYDSNQDVAHFDLFEIKDYTGSESDKELLMETCFYALINKDSNFIKLLLPGGAEGIMTECVEDTVIAILMNDGQDIVNDETENLLDDYELATNLMSLTGDELNYLHFLLETVAPYIDGELVSTIADCCDNLGNLVSSVADYYSAIGTIATNINRAQQFSAIAASQKTLLKETLLSDSNMDIALKSIESLEDQRVFKNAVNNVYTRATNASENNNAAAIDTFRSLLIDFAGGLIYGKIPVLKAWDIATTILKTIGPTSDMFDIMTHTSIAIYSYYLENMAYRVFMSTYKTLLDNQFYYNNLELQKSLIEEMQNCLVFVYKASLTARQHLILAENLGYEIFDGKLGGEFIETEQYNQSLVIMLNNLRSYHQVLIGDAPVVDEDLTWMDGWDGAEVPGFEMPNINIGTNTAITSDERDIVLVLDNSGSMSGRPIQETKKASEKFIETILKEDASIGIVKYESDADMISNFSMDEIQLKEALDELYASGGTDILSGLMLANTMLEQSNAKKQIIVLMSDGLPSNSHKELIEYAEELRKKGIIIYTLGFFEEVGYDKTSAQSLMEGMASEGCHYEVADADSLVYFFGDVADQISGQKYIYIRIACPVDVTVKYRGETLCSDVDDLNTRTSFGSLTFEENTENSDSNSKKDDRVKILRLKEGTEYDIHIEGTGRGRMNYTIGFMDEDGEYSDLRKFYNIKITNRTVIDTVASNNKTTLLEVDEDGDGRYDLQYKAKENSRGEIVETNYIWFIVGGVSLVAVIVITVSVAIKKKKIFIKKGL